MTNLIKHIVQYLIAILSGQLIILGLTIVTANEREFTRIENLTVENWINV